MEKKLKKKKYLVVLLVLTMGIGFALVTTQVFIDMYSYLYPTKWEVYFDDIRLSEDSSPKVMPVLNDTKDRITYRAELNFVGDFYEFTVDAVNNSTVDVVIDSIDATTLDASLSNNILYTITYLDGTNVEEGDIIPSKEYRTYKIRLEYIELIPDTSPVEGIQQEFSFAVTYAQSDTQDNLSSFGDVSFQTKMKYLALDDSSINFGSIANYYADNGQGLYVRNGTENDTYPIYYYRGNISNNNAKFAGYCWRIVRTTETGGIKLLYNGEINADGNCDNTEVSLSSSFGETNNSPSYLGYMYGTVYNSSEKSAGGYAYSYGNSFSYSYSSGTYTLTDVISSTSANSSHHYTCFNSGSTCSSLYYVYQVQNGISYYITLTGGKSIATAVNEMQNYTYSSNIKTVVDSWFLNSFIPYFTEQSKDYNDYLEDTVWCNDRSLNTLGTNDQYLNDIWNPNGGDVTKQQYYGAYGRMIYGQPSFSCPRKKDAFTVNDTVNGNGALTYPVGLLTTDELIFAGSQSTNSSSGSTYTPLYRNYWTMSPSQIANGITSGNYYNSNLRLALNNISNSAPVRPVISLSKSVKIVSGGDGTSLNPYEFTLD